MDLQLWFDFSAPGDGYSRVRFCSGQSNQEAQNILQHPENWANGALILTGPKGCGKSHLSSIWAQENKGKIVHSSAIPLRLGGNIVVEMDQKDCDEEGLFHLLNRTNDGLANALLVARHGPRMWDIQLGDLRSRLHATKLAHIEEPDDQVLRGILQKLCQDRLIKVDEKLIIYLVERMERSSQGALVLVEMLNARSMATSSPVNMKLAREVLQQMDETPDLLEMMQNIPSSVGAKTE